MWGFEIPMSDDTPNEVAQAPDVETGIEDRDKTPSQGVSVEGARPSGDWQMPTPIFRQTSGYLPEGFEKHYGTAEQVPSVADADLEVPTPEVVNEETPEVALAVPSTAAIDIEPQPDVIAELDLVQETAVTTDLPIIKKSGVGRIILTILH